MNVVVHEFCIKCMNSILNVSTLKQTDEKCDVVVQSSTYVKILGST